jgi:hypothetical protein
MSNRIVPAIDEALCNISNNAFPLLLASDWEEYFGNLVERLKVRITGQ